MNPELLNALIIGTVVLAVLGALFALVLAFAAKAFAVEKDPREEAIAAILPGSRPAPPAARRWPLRSARLWASPPGTV